MTFENQLGSVVSRLRVCEAQVNAIESDLAVEKAKLLGLIAEVKLIQKQLRPQDAERPGEARTYSIDPATVSERGNPRGNEDRLGQGGDSIGSLVSGKGD